MSRHRPATYRTLRQRLATLALAFAVAPAVAAPLAAPALSAGQDIKRETGEIVVNGVSTTVVRYTWRDSQGDPRSVSLVPASASTMGYAVQMSHTVIDGVKRTAYLEAMPDGDGGFGYFVSHELYRTFTDASQGTIAARHAEDDSPLGRYLPSSGEASTVGASQATQEFRVLYPRWGTVASIPQPDVQAVSANGADHQKFMLPVVVRWHFVAGRDYPLWSVQYDLTAAGDHISNDMRGPYGAMRFNEGTGPDVTALRWGDKYKFAADAAGADFGATALPPGNLAWTWNTANAGRRYNVLGSGSYELGLVDVVPFSASTLGDGYASARGTTSAAGSCGYSLQSMPCDYEWAYQSFQYDYGPPARPKLAWGTSPFLGSSTTTVYVNDTEFETIVPKGLKRLGAHIVFGRGGTGTPLTLARAAAALESAPQLTTSASPSNGGTVTYTVQGDAGGPYAAGTRALAPWDSVSLVATANAGFTFSGWSGACAGVSGTTCLVAMNQSSTVTASFAGASTFALSVTKAGTGTGTVTSTSPASPSIDCGATCSAPYAGGTVVALTAAASTGSTFTGWSGACTGTGACNVTMDAAKSVTATFTVNPPPPDPPRLGNISTRMQVLTGNDVMIGGFVIGGASSKTVAIVATGPSLANFGITNPLANPMLTLVRSSDQATIASNDDWQSAGNASQLQAVGFAPSHALEAAILISLPPGAYTAIVQGVANGTGVAVVAVYEVDHLEVPLINISTRGRVLTGNDVMIGGFVVQGSGPQTVAIVATGPSLATFGITSPLANPTITLVRSSDQATIASNDDWQTDTNASPLQAAGFAPSNALEAGLYRTLAPGAYTVIVQGVGGGTGVAVIGVYKVP
jgi:hypothetical protein